jgi:hypothetical protein
MMPTLKTKAKRTNAGLKLDMDFDEAMRRALRVKPPKKSGRRKK